MVLPIRRFLFRSTLPRSHPSTVPGIWDLLDALKFQKVKSLQSDTSGRIIGSLFDKKEVDAIDPNTGVVEWLSVLPHEIKWMGQVEGELLA